MSLKKVEQIKQDKGFKFFDIIVYAVIIALVAILFIVTFAKRNTEPLRGVRIKLYGTAVFECNFEDGSYGALTEDGSVEITDPQGGVQRVTVHSENGYNVVEINYAARTVKVVEADCKTHDCIYSTLKPTLIISGNDSLPIYCNPHAMLIEPLDYAPDYDNPDIII